MPEETPPVTITVGEKTYTAEQVAELEKGNLLNADYTQKTQALAADRKAFEAEIVGKRAGLQKEAAGVANIIKLADALAEDPDATAEQLRQMGHELRAKKNAPGTSPAQKTQIEEELANLKADIQLKEVLDVARRADPIFANHEKEIIQYMVDKKIDDVEVAIAAWSYKNPDKVKEASDFPIITHRRAGGSSIEKPVQKPGESYADLYKRVQEYNRQQKT